MINERYVNWTIFENLPSKSYEVTYRKDDEEITIDKTIKKFICQAPIGSGKSTAIRKWIYTDCPRKNFSNNFGLGWESNQ